MTPDITQAEILDFLRCPKSWPDGPDRVETIETHGAIVFMAGADVLKVKRAVHLPYLDFLTLAARKQFCEREIALNRPHAPGIYREVAAITREPDGRLAISGSGMPVEWAVRMSRFEQESLLSSIAERQGITPSLAKALADCVFDYHLSAPQHAVEAERIADTARSITETLAKHMDRRIAAALDRIHPLMSSALRRSATIRAERARAGTRGLHPALSRRPPSR